VKIIIGTYLLSVSFVLLFLLYDKLFIPDYPKDFISGGEYKEIYRTSSPDSLFDAVIIEYYGGWAMDGIFTQVYITSKGQKIVPKTQRFVARHCKNMIIKWVNKKLLNISFDEADIYNFSNFSVKTLCNNKVEYIRIKLTDKD